MNNLTEHQETRDFGIAVARLLGCLTLSISPYVLHVLPAQFGGNVFFHSILSGLIAFAVCGGMAGLLCGYWSVACGFVGLLPAYGILRAISFAERGDAIPFTVFGVVAAMVFGASAALVSALAERVSARSK